MNTGATQILNQKIKEHNAEEDERLTQFLSEKYKLPIVHIEDISVNPTALQLVKEADAQEAVMAVYGRIKGVLHIAAHEPGNQKLAEVIRDLEGRGYDSKLSITSMKTIRQIWESYRDIVATSETKPGTLLISNEDLEAAAKNIHSIEAVHELFKDFGTMSWSKKISKSVEYIVSTAIAIEASDIHMEPSMTGGVIRYRIDGVLTDIIELKEKEFSQVLIRMKLLSNMKITSKGAQDGGFVVHLPGRTISVRSSVIPEEKGGSFVARILDPENVIKDIEHLGLHPVALELFKRQVRKPNGMILTTGPTGSGKTTTLYSLLNVAKSEEVKVITIENPIEYRLSGIVQTQTDDEYTFASGLRTILRQDPDIILVGEIRDEEVANIATQASLTGHLVLSTMHTNNAIGAFSRLEQFGIDPQTFSRSVNIVIAQRLLRKLCPHCSEIDEITDEQKEKIRALIDKMPEGYRSENLTPDGIRKVGKASESCTKCTNGYKGRIGVYGMFEMDDNLRSVYEQNNSITELSKAIQEQNLPSIEDDGVYKVVTGISSLSELDRVLGLGI
ncbi:MAG: type II/IV secretion system protein [Candidatus Kaiserbacteria bacterium]|nr:type II/IV secretion system protein [Candidatus Kaiserbacteria bacterium]